jgi:hypothetical protein
LGERVETLLCGNFPEGDGIVKWKAESFPSGLYFIQLRTENRSLIEKCLLVK